MRAPAWSRSSAGIHSSKVWERLWLEKQNWTASLPRRNVLRKVRKPGEAADGNHEALQCLCRLNPGIRWPLTQTRGEDHQLFMMGFNVSHVHPIKSFHHAHSKSTTATSSNPSSFLPSGVPWGFQTVGSTLSLSSSFQLSGCWHISRQRRGVQWVSLLSRFRAACPEDGVEGAPHWRWGSAVETASLQMLPSYPSRDSVRTCDQVLSSRDLFTQCGWIKTGHKSFSSLSSSPFVPL